MRIKTRLKRVENSAYRSDRPHQSSRCSSCHLAPPHAPKAGPQATCWGWSTRAVPVAGLLIYRFPSREALGPYPSLHFHYQQNDWPVILRGREDSFFSDSGFFRFCHTFWGELAMLCISFSDRFAATSFCELSVPDRRFMLSLIKISVWEIE